MTKISPDWASASMRRTVAASAARGITNDIAGGNDQISLDPSRKARVNPLLALDRRLVIAHRGASARAPENTMAAFALALEEGADAFELDVRATADGVAVVLHDPTLDRTTGKTGPVAQHAWAELSGTGIPRFEDVLRGFPATPMIVEIKDPRAQQPVRRLLGELDLAGRCVVASEQAGWLAELRGGGLKLGATRRDIAWLWARALIGWPPNSVAYRCLAVPEWYRWLHVVTPRFTRAARALGCPVHVWTVNRPEDAERLWGMGVCGIITDDPRAMLEMRKTI